ncbi:putative addiction module antidote protein [Bradyrhizobium sp. WYCCWR 13023]|uniref:Addiction module antidote protein n=1 Tax=Bradyrhizobium zhengyangense TaxID=2911009 RepID=A0A9X1REQ9_9BRAD|nr:putative addiction module antidote protein [Bradyrhizobium zhengyangense]MDA9520138.1 addiction module antitoxin [Bradyrhizobium sp. CCBAU 11434]
MTKTYRPIIPPKLANELNKALASADPNAICRAIGTALVDFNIAEMARETGLERQSIYRAFKGRTTLPNFTTLLAVLTAMGLQLKVTPKRQRHRRIADA